MEWGQNGASEVRDEAILNETIINRKFPFGFERSKIRSDLIKILPNLSEAVFVHDSRANGRCSDFPALTANPFGTFFHDNERSMYNLIQLM